MNPGDPLDQTIEGKIGNVRRFAGWIRQSADRRMIAVWVGWTIIAWTFYWLLVRIAPLSAGSWLYGLVQHSTVYALVAAAALIRPYTLRSITWPAIVYVAWFAASGLLGVVLVFLLDSPVAQLFEISLVGFFSSIGTWIWLGVVLYLLSQFLGICVTRQPHLDYQPITLTKLMFVTALAALAFAIQGIDSGPQIWMRPDRARLVYMLSSILVAMVWCVVMWTRICSARMSLLIITVTTIAGVAVGELLFVVWSSLIPSESSVSVHHPPLWESGLSWLMSMLGIWIALRIARVGGYRVWQRSQVAN